MSAGLDAFSVDDRRAVRGIITDVDGTLTTGGRITSTALAALERAQAAGLTVIAVTGAAAGTCDAMARTWPVDAVIGESGGFVFRLHPETGRMVHLHILARDERRGHWTEYEKVLEKIVAEVPGAALAADQAYRETDLAIDHAQDVAPLAPEAIGKIVAIMEAAGMTATWSNIHVNGWLGPYDKLTTTCLVLRELYRADVSDRAERARWMFVGDSRNDAPLFEFFPHSVGVANVADFADHLKVPPAYVTPSPSGAGFAEAVDAVLAAQSSAATE
ncbi:MAG: HAD family hydrolase [Rhodospirillales bacterium CG15_BIG_FIL_POST_REV_8_21_14_020_66_15]|nr:MAG: HAD family hydrolase [Rhodospirillales bacterium CG15_BIG_FIL_POST_REV_8_21_14_020_66_15]